MRTERGKDLCGQYKNAGNLIKCATSFPPAIGSENKIDIHSVPSSSPILDFPHLQGEI